MVGRRKGKCAPSPRSSGEIRMKTQGPVEGKRLAIEQPPLSCKPDFLDSLLKVKRLGLDDKFEECEMHGK